MSPRRPSAQRIEFSAVKTDRYWKAPDSILIVVKVKVKDSILIVVKVEDSILIVVKVKDSILIVVKVKVKDSILNSCESEIRFSSKDNLVLTTVKGIMTDPAKVLAAAPMSSDWPALGFPLKTEWRIQCIEEK